MMLSFSPDQFFNRIIPLTDLAVSLYKESPSRCETIEKMEVQALHLMREQKSAQFSDDAQEIVLQLKYLKGAVVGKKSREIRELIQTIERTVWHMIIAARSHLTSSLNIWQKNEAIKLLDHLNSTRLADLIGRHKCHLNFEISISSHREIFFVTPLQRHLNLCESENAILAVKFGSDPNMTFPPKISGRRQSGLAQHNFLPPLFLACINYAKAPSFSNDVLLRIENIRVLLLAGATIEARDDNGDLYLSRLLNYRLYCPTDPNLFETSCSLLIMLSGSANFINTVNAQGRSLLFNACQIKRHRTINFLVSKGIKVRQIDIDTLRAPKEYRRENREPLFVVRENWECAEKLDNIFERQTPAKALDDYFFSIETLNKLSIPLLQIIRRYFRDGETPDEDTFLTSEIG